MLLSVGQTSAPSGIDDALPGFVTQQEDAVAGLLLKASPAIFAAFDCNFVAVPATFAAGQGSNNSGTIHQLCFAGQLYITLMGRADLGSRGCLL